MAFGVGCTGGLVGVVMFASLKLMTRSGVGIWTTVAGILVVIGAVCGVMRGRVSRVAEWLRRPVVIVAMFLAGATAWGAPVFLGLAGWVHEFARQQFVWSDRPAELLYVGVVFVAAIVPLGLIGVTTVVISRGVPYKATWDWVLLGMVFLGVSVGIFTANRAIRSGSSVDMVRLVSGLPAFLGCLAGAIFWPKSPAVSGTLSDDGFASATVTV